MDVGAEVEVRAVLEAVARAVNAKDADAIVATMTDDIVIFDVTGPLGGEGRSLALDQARRWLSIYEGPVTWVDTDVRIAAAGDVAFSHALSHVTGRLKNGQFMDMWFRSTLCFRRIGDRWLVAHNHGSVPFDSKTGKAMLNASPPEADS